MQSLFSKMAFTASCCLPWSSKYSNTIIFFIKKVSRVRSPTTVTSNTNSSHQIQIPHIKYKLLTSNTKSWHQIQITHIKNKLLLSNTNYSHQIQNPDIKHKLLTSNTNCSHQKQDWKVSGRKTKTISSFHSALTPPPFCSCTWYCHRDVLQQLRTKCRQLQLL